MKKFLLKYYSIIYLTNVLTISLVLIFVLFADKKCEKYVQNAKFIRYGKNTYEFSKIIAAKGMNKKIENYSFDIIEFEDDKIITIAEYPELNLRIEALYENKRSKEM